MRPINGTIRKKFCLSLLSESEYVSDGRRMTIVRRNMAIKAFAFSRSTYSLSR